MLDEVNEGNEVKFMFSLINRLMKFVVCGSQTFSGGPPFQR